MYDSQQFTRRDWRNRNIIRGKHGPEWLTIPVSTRGNYLAPINTIRIADTSFFPRAIRIIHDRYREFEKQQGFEFVYELFRKSNEFTMLSDLNFFLTTSICKYLGIDIRIEKDIPLETHLGKSEKLIYICERFGITSYLSGPTSAKYLDTDLFSKNDIAVRFFDFTNLSIPLQQIEWSIIHHIMVSSKSDLNLLTTLAN
jgi:hypothetical protein